MADPTDSVELALADLENEPLPTHTREHPAPPEDEVEIDYADDGLEPRQESASRLPEPERTAPRPPPQQREITPEEGVEALRAQLLASDTARRQAEDRANQAEQARAFAAGSVQEAQAQFLQSALDGAKQSVAILKANLAEAYAVQDFAQVAEIQAELTEATLRKQQIDYGLEDLKTRAQAPPPQPQPAPRQADPVEAIASRLTPNSAAWVRAHPEFITDPRKNRRLLDAHDDAMDAGLTADTPEYIRFVENQVLGGSQPRTVERRDPVAEQPRRSAPPPAPVSRGNGAGASNPTRVTLTREQRETAHENFPDEMRKDPTGKLAERAYAQNMLILQREGRMKVN